jgi:hypothetical protein
MTLAARLQEHLEARAALEAARQAARAERDAFILVQFPLLNARLLELVAEAVGLHSRIAIGAVPTVEPVVGRSFTTLARTAVHVAATLDGVVRTVSLTPRLDFTEPDQFGAVDCSLDFTYRARRSRGDALAASLLAHGVQMKGSASAHLVLQAAAGPVELGAGLLESALAALLLR